MLICSLEYSPSSHLLYLGYSLYTLPLIIIPFLACNCANKGKTQIISLFSVVQSSLARCLRLPPSTFSWYNYWESCYRNGSQVCIQQGGERWQDWGGSIDRGQSSGYKKIKTKQEQETEERQTSELDSPDAIPSHSVTTILTTEWNNSKFENFSSC